VAKATYLKQIGVALTEPLPELVRDYMEKVQSGLTQLPELDLDHMDKVWNIMFHSELLIGMLDMKENDFKNSN
jgi:hypothetical protein